MKITKLLPTLILISCTPAMANWYVQASGTAEVPLQPKLQFSYCGSSIENSSLNCSANDTIVNATGVVGETGSISYTDSSGTVVAEAFAAANLSTGILKARSLLTNPGLGNSDAAAHASFSDRLYFAIPNATAETVSTATIKVSLTGIGSSANFSIGVASYDSGFTTIDSLSGFYFFGNQSNNNFTGNWFLTGPSQYVGTFKLFGENPVVDVSSSLDVRFTADYSHTAVFTFESMPTSSTFTSESGVFLTTAVPEPMTVMTMMLGLVWIVFSLRQKQPANRGDA